MLTNVFYLKFFLVLFMAVIMYIEYKRTKAPKVKLLMIVFVMIFIKESFLIYYLTNVIPFEQNLDGLEVLKGFKGDYLNNFNEIANVAMGTKAVNVVLNSVHRFNLIWMIVEVGFVAIMFNSFNLWVNVWKKSKLRTSFLVFNSIIIVGFLFLFLTGDVSPQSSFSAIILWGGVFWNVVLLMMIGVSVGKIYKFTMEDLKYIVVNKATLIVAVVLFSIFYLTNNISTPNLSYLSHIFELLALIAFSLFGYKFLIYRIEVTEGRVKEVEEQQATVLDLLRDIGRSMAENLSLNIVIDHIIEAAVKSTDARAVAVLLIDKKRNNQLKVENVYGFYPPVVEVKIGDLTKEKFLIDKFKNTPLKVGQSYLGKVAETGEPLYIKDCLGDERVVQTAKGFMDIRTLIVVPLRIQGDIMGVMTILNKESALFFTEADYSMMNTLADQTAITLNQVKLYEDMLTKKQAEKELNVAGDIQMGLLPQTFPEFDGIDIYAFSYAAKGVGGDYFDFIDFGGGKIGVTVTDVAGKGVPAALVMVMIRSVLRSFASSDREANDVVTTVNNGIAGEVTTERYATMFYFVFDSEYKILNYCNAGHGPLLLYRKNLDSFALLDTEGMPVGILAGNEYGQEYTSLHSGDIAILYTDGITECMNFNREQYGTERLKNAVRRNKDLPVKEICDIIYKEMKEFADGAPQHDDETLLLMKAK